MKICYLCADRGIPLDGHKGASAHVRGFTAAARSLGHEVRVLSPWPGASDAVAIQAPQLLADVESVVPPRVARALAHLWTNVAVEGALEQEIAIFQPDLVYERYSPFSIAGCLVARRAGVPHVLEVNAPLAWEGSRYRRQALADGAEAIERGVFATSHSIVTVSNDLRQWLIGAGVDAEKVATVPNGVDTELFAPTGPRFRCADASAIVIGFVGTLKQWHGLDVLATAFRCLARDRRFHLVVVGDGPEGMTLQKLAKELPGRVTLAGAIAQAEVPQYIRGFDIAVAPYPHSDLFYYSPLKVLEYMAVGVPTVASEIGQLRELIEHGRNGLLVPAGDANALANALRELAGDDQRRRTLGHAAANDIAAAHTWQHRVAQILEIALRGETRQEVACLP